MKKVIVKNDSIVKKILLPMTVLLLVQAVLFCGTIFAAGTVNKLSQNAEDILNERVINRKNYLQGEMLQRWSALSLSLIHIFSPFVSKIETKQKILTETLFQKEFADKICKNAIS